MSTPRVHLLMPVYNSFSFERSNGKNLLPLVINSLLHQTFKDFELIILDNQSTDDTPTICRNYAKKDPRVRFIVDDQKRFAEAAITKLGSFATAPYCMIINDDDMYDPHYIEEAVTYMDTHPQADMVYGKCLFINPGNRLVGLYVPKENEKYGINMSKLDRFIRYANLRNILPIHYGLFKTEIFKNTLPYDDFDTLKSNIDNVFISKFFALGYQADYHEKLLFYYRRKSRVLIPEKFASNMPALDKPIGIWLFYTNHQMLFFSKIYQIAKQQGFSEKELDFVRISVMASCIQNSLNLIRSVKQEMQSQGRTTEAIKIQKIEDAYRAKKPSNITSYREFIEYASQEEGSNESRSFAAKITEILDTEIAWYSSSENVSDQYNKINKKTNFSLFNILREIVRDHLLLKNVLIGMLSIYLTIRFFPVYYALMRDTQEKNKKNN